MEHDKVMRAGALAFSLCAGALSGCGGGGDAGSPGSAPSTVLVDADVAALGPAVSTQASSWVVEVDGPQFRLDRTASVEICSQVTWQQSLLRSASLTLTQTPISPVPGGTSGYAEAAAAPSTLVTLTNQACNTHTLTATSSGYGLHARLRLDTGCPVCTNILANYSAIVRWRVTATY